MTRYNDGMVDVKRQKYVLTKDRFEHSAGTIVYRSAYYDYGLARDDTYFSGVEHASFTLNEDGDYPFFTVPLSDVEEYTGS